MLNGVNLATLSNGAAANINNLTASPLGPFHPDLILNPAGTGPVADSFRADAYTKTLHYAGKLQDGVNTLTIEVEERSTGIYDSGILVKAGTMKAVASTGGLLVGVGGGGGSGLAKIVEGDDCFKIPVTVDTGLRGNLIAPLTITITPSADIDLGNGPGVAKVTVKPGDPLTFELCVTAPNDRKGEGDEIGSVNFGVASSDPAYNGLPIAPLVLEIVDALPSVTLVADQSLEGSTGRSPSATASPSRASTSRATRPRSAMATAGSGSSARASAGRANPSSATRSTSAAARASGWSSPSTTPPRTSRSRSASSMPRRTRRANAPPSLPTTPMAR